MKNKLYLLFALLCASVMAFADWTGQVTGSATNVWLDGINTADTRTTVNYTVNYEVGYSAGTLTVTIGFTDDNFGKTVGLVPQMFVNNDYKGNFSGSVWSSNDYSVGDELDMYIYFAYNGGANGSSHFNYTVAEGGGGGGGAFDPSTIDWSSVAFISGSSQFKIYFTDANRPANYTTINVQTAPWADNNTGIYVTFPDGVSACSLIDKTGCWIEGAQVLMYLTAFVDEVTEVTITHASGTKTLYVYNASASSAEPTEIYDTNFALVSLGASATSDNGGTANNAIDNNDGSSWESTHGVDAVKLTIDLGQKRIFNTVQIRWEGAYGKAFTIDVSNDNDTWTTVKTVDEELSGFPHEQTLEFAKTTARYIRFNGTQRGTQWGYNMFSFRVLLPGVSVLTSIDLTAPAQIAEVSGTGVALTAQPKDQNGQNMEAEISWEITPVAAGHMSGSTYIPDQAGNATIRAYSGEVYSPAVTVVAYTGSNVALEKDVEASGYDDVNNLLPSYAVDNNEGSLWSARAGETGVEREYDAWIIVDLGAFYDINLIALRWEGACSKHYHVDFSADKSTWRTAYNAGWDAIATHWEYLSGTAEDATKVQYVRVWSTEAVSQYGVKIMDLKVFGTVWVPSGDTEAPVMTSASLVSSTSTSAVIAVAATDADGEVARYHVVDNVNGIDANYIPNAGNITITGLTHATNYNFTISAVDLATHESENSIVVPVTTPFDGSINLALNKTCEAGYEDGNPAETAAKANDGDENSSWVTYADRPASEEWWYVDLGDIYTLSNITAVWGDPCATNYILQARVEAPTPADKADDATWITLATVTDGAINSTKSTDVTGIGRYVRIRALARSANYFRLKELRVFGTGKMADDTEAPIMSSASLVSNTDSHATIAVAATDNVGIAKFHVVDAGNSFDAEFAAEAGNITVTGLSGGTTYNFVITAIDFFGNESANSKSVEVITTAHYTEPQAACAAPTWDASWVKAIYSPTYTADCGLGEWGSGTTATDDTYGKKYTVGPNGAEGGYFGMVDFSLNCLMMEKLHFDIWVADDMTIRFVPIWGGAEQGITKNLVGQEWNSIDIDLSDYTGITDWSNIYQMKLDQMLHNFNLWVANAYFYRETPYVDTEAPTNASASKVAEGFYSVQITAQAEDNSGAVSFKVMNGEEVLATGAAATGVATTITVNNLTPGTNYNFNVVAYDEANNEAEPVAVAASTKSIPSSAPAPDFSNKNVVAVFTDATACVVSGIQSGGWGETTQVEWLDIAPGDKVFYAQNFNFAGWHSWAGGNIDATDMQFLHVDIYSTGMTSVNVTPISEGHEGVGTISLTPNAWTSYDVPLSVYEANNIDWANIFQFKFMNSVGGDELMIDNVYFYAEVPAKDVVRDGLSAGKWGTICPKQTVENVEGATFYQISYLEEQGGLPFNMVFDQIPGTTLTAGQPYFFIANGTQILGNKTGAELTVAGDGVNGFYGYISSTDAPMELANWHTDYDANEEYNTFIIYNNSVFRINQGGTMLNSERCYININSTEPSRGVVAPAPGLKRLNMSISGTNVTTGLNALNVSDKLTKVIIDGQLYILREGKLYDLTGRMVK